MGSYAQLKVGDIEVAHFKSEVEPWVAIVFTEDDRRSRSATSDEVEYYGADEPWQITELAASAGVVRDRLDLTGADWHAAQHVFAELVEEKCKSLSTLRGSIPDEAARDHIGLALDYLTSCDLDGWVRALRDSPPDRPGAHRLQPGTRGWLIDLWSGSDVRLCLRAVLECRPDALVTVDVTDLVEGGWMSSTDDPRESALLAFGWAERHASPIVVLTEGASDARILETALAVTYPHLRGFIRFADFTQRPEANAGALAKTVKAFAAAGITNRIVALFDADTAARDVAKSLDLGKLPPSIQVRHLPQIQIAREYPTIGPSGTVVTEDINGKACSIELYLGRDVLTDSDGALRPVRWTSFINGVGARQGVIEGKGDILARFWAKAELALRDQTARASQDWLELRAVIDEVRVAFAR